MLVTPNVCEEEPPHVRKSRNLRTLIGGVECPDIGNKKLHHVDMVVGVTLHVPRDWYVKV